MYAGLAHPFAEPIQGLTLLTAAMLAARCGSARRSQALVLLLLAIIAGLVWAWVGNVSVFPGLQKFMLAQVILNGILVLIGRQQLFGLVFLLSLLSGLSAGANALPLPGDGMFATTAGSLAGSALVLIYIAGFTVWLERRETTMAWLHLVPRVAGSWCAAASFLMLALELR